MTEEHIWRANSTFVSRLSSPTESSVMCSARMTSTSRQAERQKETLWKVFNFICIQWATKNTKDKMKENAKQKTIDDRKIKIERRKKRKKKWWKICAIAHKRQTKYYGINTHNNQNPVKRQTFSVVSSQFCRFYISRFFYFYFGFSLCSLVRTLLLDTNSAQSVSIGIGISSTTTWHIYYNSTRIYNLYFASFRFGLQVFLCSSLVLPSFCVRSYCYLFRL